MIKIAAASTRVKLAKATIEGTIDDNDADAVDKISFFSPGRFFDTINSSSVASDNEHELETNESDNDDESRGQFSRIPLSAGGGSC